MLPFVPQRPDQLTPFADQVRSGRSHRLWQGQSLRLETHQAFAAALGAGEPFAVGTGVTLMPMRHPLDAALQARGLATLSGRTVVAGFGPGAVSFQRSMLGEPYARPLRAVREYVQVVRALLEEGTVDLDGEYVRVHATIPTAPGPGVRIGLGVLRSGMARLAGEVADAAITWLAPPTHLRDVLAPACAEGAERAGRAAPGLVAMVPVALADAGRDLEELVLASNAPHLSLPHYVDMLGRAGIDVTSTDARSNARALVQGGAFVHGDADDVVDALEAYAAAGVEEIVLNATGVARVLGSHRALQDLEAVIDAWTARTTASGRSDGAGDAPAVEVSGVTPATAGVPPAAPAAPAPATPSGRDGVADLTAAPTPTLREVKARLLRWAAGALPGITGAPSRTVVLAEAAHLPDLLAGDLVDDTTIVLVPGAAGEAPLEGRLVRYRGRLDETGTELALGDDFFLQVQGYGISQYVSVVGPTLVRVADVEDLEQLLDDARAARGTGVFPDAVTHPAVQLADVVALGADRTYAGPAHRLFVDAEGRCAVSPSGAVLGDLGSSTADLVAAWAGLERADATADEWALARAVPPDVLAAARRELPWLVRWVRALEMLKNLRARGLGGLRVSGFGGHLADDVPDAATPRPDDPLLAWDDERAYLGDPTTGRVFAVGRDAAGVVDALVHLDADTLAARVPPPLAASVREQLDRFGMRVGAAR